MNREADGGGVDPIVRKLSEMSACLNWAASMLEGVEISYLFHMYISLDNIVCSHTWLLFRLILYTADITTARTFHTYISLIFHDYD